MVRGREVERGFCSPPPSANASAVASSMFASCLLDLPLSERSAPLRFNDSTLSPIDFAHLPALV